MTVLKSFAILGLIGSAAACTPVGADKSFDRGINAHDVSTMVAGIWVDPDGCDHWIIDDGVEGYLSERLTPDGLPVCSGVAQPDVAVGPFKSGSPIPDPL
ncbi:hypothetical protein [Limimaricola cinnabarinus]|jgi:hypothetical protein|uniref:Cell envelope biogenesis protein OmpA n=1 Tax=Limimaricola cinnabarinus TaxID=1125964 RepID=A0A2G1ME61_9RHOB|nr:hypothetical protein [Limimaricola cinnabarinus]PHP27025.1 hypothetical protein CJ301_13655 [Limimaricola cinnabarinus]